MENSNYRLKQLAELGEDAIYQSLRENAISYVGNLKELRTDIDRITVVNIIYADMAKHLVLTILMTFGYLGHKDIINEFFEEFMNELRKDVNDLIKRERWKEYKK